jgi:hypothetical protein
VSYLADWGFLCALDRQRAAEPAFAHLNVVRKNAAMGQDGHACIASAETSRNSFSVAPLAA